MAVFALSSPCLGQRFRWPRALEIFRGLILSVSLVVSTQWIVVLPVKAQEATDANLANSQTGVEVSGTALSAEARSGDQPSSDAASDLAPSPSPNPSSNGQIDRSINDVIRESFRETHDGWSSDEVVLQSSLNEAFVQRCLNHLPDADPGELNWRLLNMRKAGLLDVKTTKSNRKSVAKFTPIAEIVARTMIDRHHLSIDRIMTVPKLRMEFDATALKIDASVEQYSVRKAAFSLRKQRRLKPELIARIADWGREVSTLPLQKIRDDFQTVPPLPGIYIFRDATGYLYIGQSVNLQTRLKEHLDASSNFSLGQYLSDAKHDNIQVELHAFAADSRAKKTMIRRAYESELIASRKPKFNIQP